MALSENGERLRRRLKQVMGDQYREFSVLTDKQEVERNLLLYRYLVANGDLSADATLTERRPSRGDDDRTGFAYNSEFVTLIDRLNFWDRGADTDEVNNFTLAGTPLDVEDQKGRSTRASFYLDPMLSGGDTADRVLGNYSGVTGTTTSTGTSGGSTSEGADRAVTGGGAGSEDTSYLYQSGNGTGLPGGILRYGSRGSDVGALQRWLNANGYDAGVVDNIFGRNTERALRDFQRDAGITADGIYGPQTRGAMGGSTASGGGDGGGDGGGSGGGGGGGGDTSLPAQGTDPAYAATEGYTWNGVPPDGEVWQIDGEYYLAYRSDVSGPYVYYSIPDERTKNAIFPGGINKARRLSQQEADRLGAVPMGTSNLLTDAVGQGWEDAFNDTLEREVATSPWLADGEVVATVLGAFLEGRAPTKAELEQTEYFASRTDAEIQYLADTATMSDSEFEQYHAGFRDNIRDMLEESGVRAPSNALVNFMAEKYASGQWNEAWTVRQVEAVSNPYSSVKMDEELKSVVEGMDLDTLRGREEEVRSLVQDWLGPMHSQSFSDEWYRQWAGSIQDDPNAINDLTDAMKRQRMALYPEYTNENLRYADIASVWEQEMGRVWGVDPSNEQQWGVLDRVIRANDQTQAGQILRDEGLRLGVEKVERDFATRASTMFGGQVISGGG